jgi:lipopolysaccharide transport system permease protein
MTRYLELIGYMSYAQLRAEVARYYIGFIWWVLEPVLYLAAFYLVFGVALQRGGEGYLPFLLTGLVVWKWFGSTVQMAATAIRANAGLIKQVYLPKFVFPCVVIVSNLFKFSLVFALLLAVLWAMGHVPNLAWFSLPVIMLSQLLLIAGVSLLVAALVPFLPDLKLVIDNGLILMLFLSGVFFEISSIPDSVRQFFWLNPMAVVIEAYRAVLLGAQWPYWPALAAVLIGSAVLVYVSLRVLSRFDRTYAKVLL